MVPYSRKHSEQNEIFFFFFKQNILKPFRKLLDANNTISLCIYTEIVLGCFLFVIFRKKFGFILVRGRIRRFKSEMTAVTRRFVQLFLL